MRLPVSEVWLHHTVTNVTKDPLADWRSVQQIAFGRGFIDISYSFGIHPFGTIMEGRGDYVGAHTSGHNSTAYGVVLIGNYQNSQPTPIQIEAVQWLMKDLKDRGKVRINAYPTGGHRDLDATACPGGYAYVKLPEMRMAWAPQPPAPSPAREGIVTINRPPVKLLSHPNWNGGYLVISDDGGVFNFPDAPFHGSLGGVSLNSPIIDAEVTPSGNGYWMMGADGGMFAFGDAQFRGRVEYNAPRMAVRKLVSRLSGRPIPFNQLPGDPGNKLTPRQMEDEEYVKEEGAE